MDEVKKKEKQQFRRSLLHKIVNVFIGITAVILFLVIVFLGFSQTSTFRNFLKQEITSSVNSSINGSLNIDRIEGSILSSVILYNTSLVSNNDTLFSSKELTIKTSPVHLLLKRILIRDIILKNSHIFLTEDETGNWSFDKLVKKDTANVQIEKTDSSTDPFPFTIQVNNFSVENLNFHRQSYENSKSLNFYKHLNFDDLRLNGIFLNAKLFANFSSSIVRLYLNNFSVDPNFQSFNLKKLSGEIELTKEHSLVNNLNLVTDSSNINISAQVDELNLLGNVELRDFKGYPTKVSLITSPFNFSDLYTFIDAVDFLNGKADINLKAEGFFGNFNINQLKLNFLNSRLNASGNVLNLHTPEKLFLDVEINDSKIVEEEAYEIIRGLDIPKFKDLVVENVNAKFKGEPTKFDASIQGKVKNGSVSISTFLDLQSEEMDYDIKFDSKNIDLFSVIGYQTSITSSGVIKGKGTNPQSMNAALNLKAFNSTFDSYSIDSLYFNTKINSRILDLDFSSIINDAPNKVLGLLDINNNHEPIYNLRGNIGNLELRKFTSAITDTSNLNFSFSAIGKNLALDSLVGNYEIVLEPSFYKNLNIDSTSINIKLQRNKDNRDINLKSEFVDFNIDGKFSLEKAIDVLVYEGVTISQIIHNKIEELNPVSDSVKIINNEIEQTEIPQIAKEDLEFNYNFVFKDFELIALFLNNDELDITGSGEGTVKNDSLHFEISTDINIDNLLNKRKNDIFYLSNVIANLNFSRDNRVVSFNKIFGTLSLEGEKVYAGIDLNNIQADLIFNQSKLFFNTSLGINDDLKTEVEGLATTSSMNEKLLLSNILINYKNIPWQNYDTCTVLFNDDGMQISNIILENGSSIIKLNGQINNDESHNIFASIENMPGAVLSDFIFDEEDQQLGGDVNLSFISNGFLSNPDINVELNIYDISYNNVNFGTLTCYANHRNQKSLFDIDFKNYATGSLKSLLTVDGNIPLKINYLSGDEILNENSELSISMRSSNFDIGTFGNILPYIKNQTGKIKSKIDIAGPLNNIDSRGYITLSDVKFTSRQNNLDYSLGIKTVFDKQVATIDSFLLGNKGGSRYTGEIEGSGTIELKEFPFSDFDFTLKGDLALLGRNSQTRSSTVYGDLFVKANKPWKFNYHNEEYNFNGDIIVERANLVYTSQKSTNIGDNERIIYKFIEDSSKVNLSSQKFVKYLNETKSKTIVLNETPTKFNFNTNIIIDNIATFTFIIAPDLNQKLSVETTGKFQLESVGDNIRSQGSLALLNGSRLEFFKTFDAVGNIGFESDLTDPHFDIVATYIGTVDDFENSGKTEDVAVKLKLNTSYSKLKENLSSNKDNLSVYVGRSDIENNVPDPKYGQSNALTFVILDQLTLDLNDQQKSTLYDMTENAAFSLLGSQLTNYLSSSLGGIINNIKFNKYSGRDSYKLLFSGKYNNIRYSFGGNFGSQTDYLQLSKADIKVEYLINPNFLIRVEQKDPIIETTAEEKVRELGLKYKFVF